MEAIVTSALFGTVSSALRHRSRGRIIGTLAATSSVILAAFCALPAWADTAPAAPTGLALYTQPAPTSIEVYWQDNASNESSFTIERESEDQTSYSAIGSSPPQNGTGTYGYYTDSGLNLDTSYSYRIKAVNATGSSAYDVISTLR